ncbi:MAG: nuclear transport factor 2 family protein [Woeseiaceae bacterium]|nr:nuclear transport factor 2 family protein [Woeseiaceae bacterium]
MMTQGPHGRTDLESESGIDLPPGPIAVNKPASSPNELERFFVERANRGDVDGLVALYEPNAVLIADNGQRCVGKKQIRDFFVKFLMGRPQLSQSVQDPALRCGELALTSSRHSNGGVSVEVARRQADGNWLWVIDRFTIAGATNYNPF